MCVNNTHTKTNLEPFFLMTMMMDLSNIYIVLYVIKQRLRNYHSTLSILLHSIAYYNVIICV